VAKKLTAKQQSFVEEYLVDLNATQAAIRAGYSERTAKQQGSRLLTNADVLRAVDEGQERRTERVEVTQDYVLDNLTEIVERCMQRSPVMVRRGRLLVQATDDEGRDVWRFDAKGATAALTLLGKHLGLFAENVNLRTPDGPLAIEVTRQVVPAAANRITEHVGSNGANGNGRP
jgi:phage terminase small subunit